MSLNSETGWVLKTQTSIGLAIMALGLVLSILGLGEIVIAVGVIILIFAPVVGVLVSTKCLIQEKDYRWTRVAFVLIAVVIIGMIVSYLT